MTAVAAAGIAVATAAMICVLSVMNGFGSVVEEMFSLFDPDIRITVSSGKYFNCATDAFAEVQNLEQVESFSRTIEDNALVRFSDKQASAILKGVDENFAQTTSIESIIVDGDYSVYDGAFERTVMGRGLANTLGISAHFVSGMRLYAPQRNGRVNMLAPEKSLIQASVWIAGVFAVNQVKYDDNVMLVSLQLAQELFDCSEGEVTAIELRLKPDASVKSVKKQISNILGDCFVVADRYEQQEDFFRILKIEKVLTILLLSFILLIAILNIVGSLSMLIIDKKDDMQVLRSLGASENEIFNIFLFEGWLISLLGAAAGLVLGAIICYIQMKFGILKLGDGTNYIISAYPVALKFTDLLLTGVIVTVLGFISAFIPALASRSKIPVILAALFLVACTHTPEVEKKTFDETLDKGYAVFYGNYYEEEGIKSNVISLDLYSSGIMLDSVNRVTGTGTNVYLSDVFVRPTDIFLPRGTLTSDTTAASMTFLPGIQYEGDVSGAYLLDIKENGYSIALVKKGEMMVSYSNDSTIIDFTLLLADSAHTVYNGRYKGILIYYDGRLENE